MDLRREAQRLWGSEIAYNPPKVQYEEVMDKTSTSGLAKLTDALVSLLHSFPP